MHGTVVAPRSGSAWVRIVESGTQRQVRAANHLNVRAPPGARVLVARLATGRYAIIGRRR